MDCCLRKVGCLSNYTTGMLLYRDVCSPWDIVLFHCMQRQFFTVPPYTVGGRSMQDSICDTFQTISVQGNAVRTLQRTGHLRVVNGSSSARIAMVPLPCVFGRHHLFRDDVRRRTGQPDIDFRASALLWTAIEVNKVSSVPDVCAFSGTCRWQRGTAMCAAIPGILQTVYLQFFRHGIASGLLGRKGRPIRLATSLCDGIH